MVGHIRNPKYSPQLGFFLLVPRYYSSSFKKGHAGVFTFRQIHPQTLGGLRSQEPQYTLARSSVDTPYP